MSIPAVNAAYFGTGPTVTNEILASQANSQNLSGTMTAVLDGSATTFVVNWIDGTAVLPFTPSGAMLFRSGGTGLSTIAAVAISSITSTSATVTISAAGTSTNTVILTFTLFK